MGLRNMSDNLNRVSVTREHWLLLQQGMAAASILKKAADKVASRSIPANESDAQKREAWVVSAAELERRELFHRLKWAQGNPASATINEQGLVEVGFNAVQGRTAVLAAMSSLATKMIGVAGAQGLMRAGKDNDAPVYQGPTLRPALMGAVDLLNELQARDAVRIASKHDTVRREEPVVAGAQSLNAHNPAFPLARENWAMMQQVVHSARLLVSAYNDVLEDKKLSRGKKTADQVGEGHIATMLAHHELYDLVSSLESVTNARPIRNNLGGLEVSHMDLSTRFDVIAASNVLAGRTLEVAHTNGLMRSEKKGGEPQYCGPRLRPALMSVFEALSHFHAGLSLSNASRKPSAPADRNKEEVAALLRPMVPPSLPPGL